MNAMNEDAKVVIPDFISKTGDAKTAHNQLGALRENVIKTGVSNAKLIITKMVKAVLFVKMFFQDAQNVLIGIHALIALVISYK